MDPNAALANLREVMPRLRAWEEAEVWSVAPTDLTQHDDDLRTAVDSFEALDEWLSKDGFLPSDWAAEEDKPSPCTEAGKHLKTEAHGWYSCPAVTRVGS